MNQFGMVLLKTEWRNIESQLEKRESKTPFFPTSFRTFALKGFQLLAGFPLNAFAITNVQMIAALFDKENFLKETVLFSSKPAYN